MPMVEFKIALDGDQDPVEFSTLCDGGMPAGLRIRFDKLPIQHPSRRFHLTLNGWFRVDSSATVFDRKGLRQEVTLVPDDGQTLSWTEHR